MPAGGKNTLQAENVQEQIQIIMSAIGKGAAKALTIISANAESKFPRDDWRHNRPSSAASRSTDYS
jgi:hypothetical protein